MSDAQMELMRLIESMQKEIETLTGIVENMEKGVRARLDHIELAMNKHVTGEDAVYRPHEGPDGP